jgi:hypothetical protein
MPPESPFRRNPSTHPDFWIFWLERERVILEKGRERLESLEENL